MALIPAWIPSEAVLNVFSRELSQWENITARLFTDTFTVNQDTKLVSFTEAVYDNYSPVSIPYTGPSSIPLTTESITFNEADFFGPISSGDVTINGFYVTYEVLGTEYLLGASTFPGAPLVLTLATDQIRLFLYLSMFDNAHP